MRMIPFNLLCVGDKFLTYAFSTDFTSLSVDQINSQEKYQNAAA